MGIPWCIFLLRLFVYLLGYHVWQDGVFKMNLSPDGALLAAIHFSGKLTIWSIPSLRQQGEWDQTAQVRRMYMFRNLNYISYFSGSVFSWEMRGVCVTVC